MSYSVCLYCREMVSGWEKYCRRCREKHGLPNLPTFQMSWKLDKPWYVAAHEEVEKDLLRAQLDADINHELARDLRARRER